VVTAWKSLLILGSFLQKVQFAVMIVVKPSEHLLIVGMVTLCLMWNIAFSCWHDFTHNVCIVVCTTAWLLFVCFMLTRIMLSLIYQYPYRETRKPSWPKATHATAVHVWRPLEKKSTANQR